MVSWRQLVFFLYTQAMFLFLFSSSSSCQKVSLNLYYETMCPYCADFIVNDLVKIFETGLISIVDLRLIPWGNAVIGSDGSAVCQHGAAECLLNTIAACAINTYPDVETHFRIIYCTEKLALDNKLNEWNNCLEIAGLSKTVIDCYTGGYGNLLEQRYAAETSQLNPPHRFVPWLVVNDQPLQEDYMNFIKYVCDAYGGSQLPEACRLFSNSLQQMRPSNLVCYANN